MRKIVLILLLLISSIFLFLINFASPNAAIESRLWEFQSIDTMKYSRDLAREKISDPSFDLVIEKQIKDIKDTGATHVGIATPYDEEFYPFLKRWVDTARRHGLKVWFRGNFSGWEGWFEYPKITREEHLKKTRDFILAYPELFEDGDAFSACPECENGGPGDPRHNGDVEGHRNFLISEYKVTTEAFNEIGKNVGSHYHSMNGDVARLIMDDKTTKALNSTVVVDHYVASPQRLAEDVLYFSKNGKTDVILGEFGVAIPDLHGQMSDQEQAEWLNEALSGLSGLKSLKGLSYWTNVGGSTELWHGEEDSKKAEVLRSYYIPRQKTIIVKNAAGDKLDATLLTLSRKYQAEDGEVSLPHLFENQEVIVSHNQYKNNKTILRNNVDSITVILEKENENNIFKIKKVIFNLRSLFMN